VGQATNFPPRAAPGYGLIAFAERSRRRRPDPALVTTYFSGAGFVGEVVVAMVIVAARAADADAPPERGSG
jgi:hypothetical protein